MPDITESPILGESMLSFLYYGNSKYAIYYAIFNLKFYGNFTVSNLIAILCGEDIWNKWDDGFTWWDDNIWIYHELNEKHEVYRTVTVCKLSESLLPHNKSIYQLIQLALMNKTNLKTMHFTNQLPYDLIEKYLGKKHCDQTANGPCK